MDDLTGFFPTTDRVHAEEALDSFRAQGIPRPIVVVRNVRPMLAAFRRTLECETDYMMVVDDDVILEPGVARRLLELFRSIRETRPKVFLLTAKVYSEARQRWGKGGVKLYYMPWLRRVGWPDAPHMATAQKKIAKKMGFEVFESDVEAGVQKRGSHLDVYKKYVWIQVRARAGQHRPASARKLVRRAHETGEDWLWFAALGVVDGDRAGARNESKDEHFVGPIGRTLDVATLTVDRVREILAGQGVPGASPGSVPPRRGLLQRLGLKS